MNIYKHPILCNYYLTYRCNAKCSFCDIWEKPSPYVNLEEYSSNIINLKKLGVKVIDFTGGEPLLHRELPLLLEKAKHLGFITTVTTNTLLYPKLASKLKAKVDMLHFSLDSVYKDNHNTSRGVECYDFFIESLKIAENLGEKVDILFTVTNENIHEIESIYNQFIINNNRILILNPIFAYNEVGGALSNKNIKILYLWQNKPKIYINTAFLKLRENGGNQIENPVCFAGSSTIVITPDNKLVLPCYHLGLKEIDIDNNLYKLWHSENVQNIIKMEGKLPKCQGCTINCYMQPSFSYKLNKYYFYSLPSTIKYTLEKWVY